MERKYKYISAIAQYGSILKASEKLYITPSALSKYVQTLENQLGVHLFDRIGKRFVLTYAGERYLDWMNKMVSVNEGMLAEMHDISHANRGRLRVGIQMSRANLLVDGLFPQFYVRYPNAKVELYEGSSRELWQMLEDNVLDFAFVPDEVENVRIQKIPLAVSHVVIIASPILNLDKIAIIRDRFAYPWLDIHALKDYPFVAPFPTQESYAPYETLYATYGFRPNIVFQAKSIGTLLHAVNNNFGITITKDQIAQMSTGYNSLQFFSFGDNMDPEAANNYVLAYRKGHHLDVPSQSFISLCQSYFQSL